MECRQPAQADHTGITPFDFRGQKVRVVTIEGSPWFVTRDVCEALGRGNPANALRILDADQKGLTTCQTLGGAQTLSVVSESGLYVLIMRAQRTGLAKDFQDWVTRDVLPAIRKDGMYVAGEEKVRTGEIVMARGLLAANEAADYSKILLQRPCLLPTDSLALSDG